MYELQKKLIVKIGKEIYKLGLTKSTGGNISIFIPEKKIMLITPSGIPYESISVDSIVEMELNGKMFTKNPNPSSEWRMHAEAYKVNKNHKAIIHAHSLYLTIISTLFKELPAIDYLIALSGKTKVSVTNYKRYGTKEIAEESARYLKNSSAIILANHGVNVASTNLKKALMILENIEFCAEVFYKSKIIGQPKIIDENEINELIDVFKKWNYGLD